MQASTPRTWGFGVKVRQPAQRRHKLYCGDERLQLSEEQLIRNGDRADQISSALRLKSAGALMIHVASIAAAV